MKRAIAIVAIAGFVFLGIWLFAFAERKKERSGLVVLCGGGLEFSKGSNKAAESLADLARTYSSRGRRPKLASIQSGAPSLIESEIIWLGEPNDPGYKEIFEGLGFEPFFVPLTIDNSQIKNDAHWVSLVADADVVFLNGGDQIRHVRSLLTADDRPSPMLLAIKGVLAKGGAVVGTSAGTHAAGDVMFGGGTSEGALNANRTYAMPKGSTTLSVPGDSEEVLSSYGTGLGLVAGILLDSHAGARGRVGRMLVALATIKRDGYRPTPLGFGVDENTCLFWSGASQTGIVRGQGSVWIIDITSAEVAPASAPLFSADDVVFAFASDGDNISLKGARNKLAVEVRSDRPNVLGEIDPKSFLPPELFGKGKIDSGVTIIREKDSKLFKKDDGSAAASGLVLRIETR